MKVSVTNIETYRLFKTEDWMSHDDLITSLLGEEPQNVAMASSEAFHDLLRRAQTGTILTYEQVGRFRFDLESIDDDLVLRPLRELRAQKVYRIGDVELEVRGRVDGADGMAVDDHKIKFGTFDAERYADSVQWKLYLDMLGGRIFNYNVFIGKYDDDGEEEWNRLPCPLLPDVDPPEHECVYELGLSGAGIVQVGDSDEPVCGACDAERLCESCKQPADAHTEIEIALREFHPLRLYAYPELHSDVIDILTDYVAFARQHLTDEALSTWRARRARAS